MIFTLVVVGCCAASEAVNFFPPEGLENIPVECGKYLSCGRIVLMDRFSNVCSFKLMLGDSYCTTNVCNILASIFVFN